MKQEDYSISEISNVMFVITLVVCGAFCLFISTKIL